MIGYYNRHSYFIISSNQGLFKSCSYKESDALIYNFGDCPPLAHTKESTLWTIYG